MQEKYLKWIFEELEKRSKTKERDDESTVKSINKCIEENKKKISNLLDMKIKEMISDDEYWELKDKKLLVLQQKQLEIIKVITQPFRGPNGVFKPFEIVYIKPKTTLRDTVLSTMQDLVEAVAIYFQSIDPGSVYVPKCDRNKFEYYLQCFSNH